jgi:hypothetical protein
MFAIFILLLFAVAPLLSDDLRSQAWIWIASGVCWLAIIGLAYGKWREWEAQQGMMDQRRRR